MVAPGAHFSVHFAFKTTQVPSAVWRQQSLILILSQQTVHEHYVTLFFSFARLPCAPGPMP